MGWKPLNKRIVKPRFNTRLVTITVVQVYAPTEATPDDERHLLQPQRQRMSKAV